MESQASSTCPQCGRTTEHWQQHCARKSKAKLANETASEVRQLLPLFIEPLQNLRDLPARVWRTAAIIATVGVLPLAITAFGADEFAQYWAIALYFSVLWCFFFYYVFRPRAFNPAVAASVFLFTGVVSMTLLLALLGLGLQALREPLLGLHFAPIVIPASVALIGVPEELTKALAVILLARFFHLGPLRTFLVYGLISGLGFGIYEGIQYQTVGNVAAFKATEDLGSYYLSNVLRLTAMPFLHACWTGLAAYFIWFGTKFPVRKAGLYALAIAVPATLHGVYDGVLGSGMDTLGWPIAALSAVLLCAYIGCADRIEQRLKETFGESAGVSRPVRSGAFASRGKA